MFKSKLFIENEFYCFFPNNIIFTSKWHEKCFGKEARDYIFNIFKKFNQLKATLLIGLLFLYIWYLNSHINIKGFFKNLIFDALDMVMAKL